MIRFLKNFQMNNFYEIFEFRILLYLTLYILISAQNKIGDLVNFTPGRCVARFSVFVFVCYHKQRTLGAGALPAK